MERKTDVPGIYKVCEGVLINKDDESLRSYKMRKEKERKMQQLQEDFYSLREDIDEIKSILKGLVK